MNKNPNCPRCQSPNVIKSGKIQGKQRHKCNACGRQFTRLTPKGKPPEIKAQAIELYTRGLSMRSIACMLEVSATSVMRWIRNFAEKTYEKPQAGHARVMELDEMWHYVKSKKTNFGSGKPGVGIQDN